MISSQEAISRGSESPPFLSRCPSAPSATSTNTPPASAASARAPRGSRKRVWSKGGTRSFCPRGRSEEERRGRAPVVSGHQGRYEMREIVNALLYQSRTGCQWDLLPHAPPPPAR
ncbi:transposase [Streptomyces litchfieldiae]|uniref:transposase n=1 Tax=Streptomyces litchfieldiae TaxID=3075543 RepID=UPI00374DFC60